MATKFVILATGMGHFLDPCAIVEASTEPAAVALVAQYNPKAAKECRLVAESVPNSDVQLYLDQGALLIENGRESDLLEAF